MVRRIALLLVLLLAVATASACEPAAPAVAVRRGPTDRRIIALTFDAGSDRGYTTTILDTLRAKGVHAAFGITGAWARANPALIRRMVAEGHLLVNHTDDHRSFTGYSTQTRPLTAAQRSDELARAETAADGVGRHPSEVETAVYFCCLEAMQNAGKHAGEGSRLTVTVTEEPGWLRFAVSDDGAGFDADAAVGGDGFVNMADRLGAVGGTLRVTAQPGSGATVAGDVPLAPT